MIVTDDQLQPMKSTREQKLQELTPMHFCFREFHAHTKNTPTTALRDPIRNQQGTVNDRIILTENLFVSSVQQQIAGCNTVNVHLRHGYVDCTFTSHSLLKTRWIKTSIPRLRDSKLDLALKRIDGARFESICMVCSFIRPLIRFRVEIVLPFHFHDLIEEFLHDFTHSIKTFFRNDLQNRLRHAKFFDCDKSFRFFIFREG